MTIVTTLPYSLDVMRQLITSIDEDIVIDYDNSKIQGTAALIYLSNVNMFRPTIKTTNVQSAYSLIDSYIMLKSVGYVESLVYSIIGLLLDRVGAYQHLSDSEKQEIATKGLLTHQQYQQYVQDPTRAKNLDNLVKFLNSLPLFALSCSVEYTQAFGKIENTVETIDDINFTGYTFVDLLNNDLFVFNFFGVPPTTSVAYFKQHFQEYVYNGRSLFAILRENQSPIIPLLDCILKQTITPEMIVQANLDLAEAHA